MSRLLTRYRRQDWGGLQGGSGDGSRIRDDFTVLPPDPRVSTGEIDRSIRCERRFGDTAPWSNQGQSGAVSVAQVQAAVHQSAGQSRWISMWTRIDQLAAYSNLDFHFIHEVHSQGSQGSAPWGENVTTSPLQRQLRRTPSSGFDHLWPTAARSAITLGGWYWAAFGCSHTTATNGFFEMMLNADLIYSATGIRTSGDGTPWYPKLGAYTWDNVQGTDIFYIAAWELHDSRPAFPGTGGGPPPASPSVEIVAPPATTTIFVGSLPYEVEVTDAPDGSTLYVGVAPLGEFDTYTDLSGDSTKTGALDLSGAPDAGQVNGLYAALHNSLGTQLDNAGFNVTCFPPEETTPPADPIEIGFASEATSESSFGLDYEVPEDVTVDPDLVVARIPSGTYDADSRAAVALLLERGFTVSPPYHFFHTGTDERLDKRADGTFTPHVGS